MDAPVLPASLYTVKAIAILDNDGERIISKYYDETYPTQKEQKAFEKNLFSKTHRANAEIIMLEGLTCVYRSNVDLYFYVIGSSQENELILVSVLNCLYDSISQILRKNVEKRALLDHLDAAFLAVDEIVDGGIILESDYNNVVQRIAVRGDDIPINEQTVAQVLTFGQTQVSASFAVRGRIEDSPLLILTVLNLMKGSSHLSCLNWPDGCSGEVPVFRQF